MKLSIDQIYLDEIWRVPSLKQGVMSDECDDAKLQIKYEIVNGDQIYLDEIWRVPSLKQ